MNAEQCMAAAENALVSADKNMTSISEQITKSLTGAPMPVVVSVLEAQIKLGQAWRDLAALKSFETER